MSIEELGKRLQDAAANGELVLDKSLLRSDGIMEFLADVFGYDQFLFLNPVVTVAGQKVLLAGDIDLFGDGSTPLTATFTSAADGFQLGMEATKPACNMRMLAECGFLPESYYEASDYPDLDIRNAFVKIDSSARSLSIQGKITDQWQFIGLSEFPISNIGFDLLLELSADGKKKWSVTSLGSLKLGSNDVSVAIGLPVRGSSWSVREASGNVPLPALSDLGQLVGGDALINALPEEVNNLSGLTLSRIELRFAPENKTWVSVALTLSFADQELRIVPGLLSIRGVGLELEVTLYRPDGGQPRPSIHGAIVGTVDLGGMPFAITIPILEQSGAWVIRQAEAFALPRLSDLLSLVGAGSLATALPPALDSLGQFTLSNMEIGFDPPKRALNHFSFAIGSGAVWEIPGFEGAAVRDLLVTMSISNPTDPQTRALSGLLYGTLRLGKGSVKITVKKTPSELGWTLGAKVGDGGSLILSDLADAFLPKEVSLPDEVPDLELTSLDFSANPTTGEFALAGRCTAKWDLPFGVAGLAVSTVDIDLQRGPSTMSNGRTTPGLLNCSLKLAGTGPVEVVDGLTFNSFNLNFDLVNQASWSLSGSVAAKLFDVDYALAASAEYALATPTQRAGLRRLSLSAGITSVTPLVSLPGVGSLDVDSFAINISKSSPSASTGASPSTASPGSVTPASAADFGRLGTSPGPVVSSAPSAAPDSSVSHGQPPS